MAEQAQNFGNDFVAAFSRGIQDRMEGQKTQATLEEQKLMRPHKIAQLKAEIEASAAQTAHAKAAIDALHAQRESQIRQEFATGQRMPQSSPAVGVESTQQASPGSPSSPSLPLTPGAASSYNLAPDATINQNQTVNDPLLGQNAQISGAAFPGDIAKQKLMEYQMMLAPQLQKEIFTQHLKTEGEKEVKKVEGQNQEKVANINRTSAEKIAQGNNENQLNVANLNKNAVALEGEQNRLKDLQVAGIHAQAQMKSAQLRANAVKSIDPETNAGYEQAVLAGAIPFAQVPKDAKNALVKDWNAKGYIPPDNKVAGVLKSVPLINDILHNALDMAVHNSGIGSSISVKTGYGDTANKYRALSGLGGQLAELFSKEVGRKNDNDIKRAINLIYNPQATAAENIQNVDKAAKILVEIVKPHLAPYMKSGQASEMLKLHGVDSGSILDPDLVQQLKANSGVK